MRRVLCDSEPRTYPGASAPLASWYGRVDSCSVRECWTREQVYGVDYDPERRSPIFFGYSASLQAQVKAINASVSWGRILMWISLSAFHWFPVEVAWIREDLPPMRSFDYFCSMRDPPREACPRTWAGCLQSMQRRSIVQV